MSQVLVVGLPANTSPDHVHLLKEQIESRGIAAVIIAGATSLAVIEVDE